jgi:4-hydroxy-2-oxoheptanedioate aldolase
MSIDFSYFFCLKGEFEAEGLSRENVASEALYAARHGMDYLVKISGAEAKSDVFYLEDLGLKSLVCPMIETPFAMRKYMEMLTPGTFDHIGVTIETITAVHNIDGILEQGHLLTDVTIGRTDLTASYSGDGVESPKTIDMVKTVAKAARKRGLTVTMGGSISKNTWSLLKKDAELRDLLQMVETRKVVLPVQKFLDDSALGMALSLEEELLRARAKSAERALPPIKSRIEALAKRRN